MSWRPEERALLQAAKALEPAAGRNRERLLACFSTASAVSLAAASVKAAMAVEASLALQGAGATGLGMIAKATVIGGTMGAAAAMTANGLEPTEPPVPSDPTRTASGPIASGVRQPGAAETSSPDAPPRAADPPKRTMPKTVRERGRDVEPPEDAREAPGPRTAFRNGAAADIEDEDDHVSRRAALEALDAARAAVAARNPRAAQAALNDYDAHRGDGRLDPEAALLRLRTLQIAGHCTQAASLAEQWLTQQPQTTYASALRALMKECRR